MFQGMERLTCGYRPEDFDILAGNSMTLNLESTGVFVASHWNKAWVNAHDMGRADLHLANGARIRYRRRRNHNNNAGWKDGLFLDAPGRPGDLQNVFLGNCKLTVFPFWKTWEPACSSADHRVSSQLSSGHPIGAP